MRGWFVAMACAAALGLTGAARAEMAAGQATMVQHPMLSVTGTGTVEVAPDTVRIAASIITEGESVEVARERNAQIVERAMAAVEALKLPNVTTKTLNYTMERVTDNADTTVRLDPEQWDIPWRGVAEPYPPLHISFPVTLGYRASNSLTVRLQGGTREEMSQAAGRIIDALMGAGCNQITTVTYSLEKDNTEALRQALVKAVQEAQMTAEAVAAAAGRRIVGIRSISPGYMRPMPEMRMVQAGYGGYGALGEAAMTPTPLTAGMLELSAQVTIAYELDYNPGDTEFLPSPGR